MRDQRVSLEQQLRELIQKDDITASLVTTDHSEMKVGWISTEKGLCFWAPYLVFLFPSFHRNCLRSS